MNFFTLFNTYIFDCLSGGPRDHRIGYDTVDVFHQRLDSYRDDSCRGDVYMDGCYGLSNIEIIFCLDCMESD